MMIVLLAVAVTAAEPESALPRAIADPPSCRVAERARVDQMATINARFAGARPDFGPLGRQYQDVSDRLAKAMTAEDPDLERIGALWRQADQVRVQIGARWMATQTQCTLDRLKLLPLDERKKFLRGMAPMTLEQRQRIPVVPPAPPPPQPRHPELPTNH